MRLWLVKKEIEKARTALYNIYTYIYVCIYRVGQKTGQFLKVRMSVTVNH